MTRRLFWVAVGVGLTVVVIHKGRQWYAQVVPEPAAGAVDTAISVSRGVRGALEQFRAGRDEKEAELMAALIGDRDVDELKATARQRKQRLARQFADWSDQPTEDPEDDAAGYSF
ncbi:MAG: hypothetical protein FWF02_01980 [Micrococcales bacterium]|nr:hypothetical protein [Micrococcales bacterium]MCL2666460.1 hypothetical protein [Micrococcales bacterium]